MGDWTLIRLLIETLRKWKPINQSDQTIFNSNNVINDDISKSNVFTSLTNINTIGGVIGSEADDRQHNQQSSDRNMHQSLLSIEEEAQFPVQINLTETSHCSRTETNSGCSDSTKSIVGSRENLASDI